MSSASNDTDHGSSAWTDESSSWCSAMSTDSDVSAMKESRVSLSSPILSPSQSQSDTPGICADEGLASPTSPSRPPSDCSAMSMGSDGSIDSDAECQTWDDEPSFTDEIPLFEIADECNFTGNWTPFLDRLKSHPQEVHDGRPGFEKGDRPTVLHVIVSIMDCDEQVPVSVIKAVLDVFPSAARILPLPLLTAVERISKGEGCLAAECVQLLVDAYPGAVKERINVKQYYCSSKDLPIHNICKIGDVPGEEVTEEVAKACMETAQILLSAYPEGALVEGRNMMIPLSWIGRGGWLTRRSIAAAERDEEWLERVWKVYVVVLRGTCRALYAMHDAPAEEVDSLLLHTAIRFNQRNDAIDLLMKKMPHLAKCRDNDGYYPLSWLQRSRTYVLPDEVLGALIELNPDAAGVLNEEGMYPLHSAISRGCGWKKVKCILDAAPEVLVFRDKQTRLYPFMLAAEGHSNSIDVVYQLLREQPTLASGLAEDSPYTKTEKRIRKLEKERDGWKARFETVSRENKELRSRLGLLANSPRSPPYSPPSAAYSPNNPDCNPPSAAYSPKSPDYSPNSPTDSLPSPALIPTTRTRIKDAEFQEDA